MSAGMDNNRLVLLLAVLEKKAGLRLCDKDVYTNVVGGLRLEEAFGGSGRRHVRRLRLCRGAHSAQHRSFG